VNAYYDGTNWRTEDTATPGGLVLMAPTTAAASPLFALYDLPGDAGAPGGRFSVARDGTTTAYGRLVAYSTFSLQETGTNSWLFSIEGNQWVVRPPAATPNCVVMQANGDTAIAGYVVAGTSLYATANVYARGGRLNAGNETGATYTTIDWNGYITAWGS